MTEPLPCPFCGAPGDPHGPIISGSGYGNPAGVRLYDICAECYEWGHTNTEPPKCTACGSEKRVLLSITDPDVGPQFVADARRLAQEVFDFLSHTSENDMYTADMHKLAEKLKGEE